MEYPFWIHPFLFLRPCTLSISFIILMSDKYIGSLVQNFSVPENFSDFSDFRIPKIPPTHFYFFALSSIFLI